ncbi:MAG: tyrosine-protein phosphatase [Clostridiales bacterium]|nr:tyrosine-protein phosphatase [Clostridiales bacterium]
MGDKDRNIKRSGKKTAFLAAFLACSLCLLCFALYYWNPSVRQYLITGGRIHMISIDGIFNVRDIGGWKTTDGKSIRYGLVFRGSEMDGIHHVNISAQGIEQMKDLGIRTEVDLRNSEETETAVYPLKSFADYSRYEIEAYMGVSRNKDLYKEALSAVIDGVLNDRPVYVHCWGGADRTGTVIALLEGTLGVSKMDVIKDYELTSFSPSGVRRYGSGNEGTQFKDLVEYIESDFEGGSFKEKCTNLLLDLGISKDQIEAFRAKMLE